VDPAPRATTSRLAAHTVVLAACSTIKGPASRGEVIMGLARPFLLKGVRNAIVSLWDIPDAATTQLMVQFHRSLGTGVPPSVALTHAQRQMIESSGNASRTWASFIVVSN
jgi:CHAT domain-containing protein